MDPQYSVRLSNLKVPLRAAALAAFTSQYISRIKEVGKRLTEKQSVEEAVHWCWRLSGPLTTIHRLSKMIIDCLTQTYGQEIKDISEKSLWSIYRFDGRVNDSVWPSRV